MNRSATAIESKLIPAVRGSDDEHDRALMRRYVEKRDTEALGELLNLHAHAAFRLACHFSANASDAEDSVQAAAVNLVHHAGKFDHQREGSVRLWIMGIVVNVCRKKRLENSRRAAREQRAASQRTTITLPDYGGAEKAQLHQEVAKAVRTLPVLYRAPLSLHYYEGLTSTEVAAVLQIPENTIRSQIKRGIERLREMLTASGITLSVVELGAAIGALQLEQAPASLLASLQETARQAPSLAGRARQQKKARPRDNSAGWKVAAGAALVAVILLLLWMWNSQRNGGLIAPQAQVANVDAKTKQTSKTEQILQKGAVVPDAAPAQRELAPVVDPGLKDPLKQHALSTIPPIKLTQEKDPMKASFKNAILGTVLALASASANARAADVSKAPDPNAAPAVAGPVVPELLDPGSPEITGLAVISDVNSTVDHVDTLVRAFNAQIPAGLIKMQLGMVLNDPGLAHLDTSKPVVAMMLKSAATDASAPLAIFIPAKADAPYAAMAERAQWVSSFKDGVLILASTPDALKTAQGQTAAYNKIASTTIAADTRIFINNANLLAAYRLKFQDFVSTMLEQSAATKSAPGIDPAKVAKGLKMEWQAVLNLLAQSESEQIDITLKGDAITIDTVAKAVKDSALSDLFNTAPQDANKTLNYLTSSGVMAGTARFDPVRGRACVEKILKGAAQDPEFAEFLTPEVTKFVNDWMMAYGGDFATTTSIIPKVGMNVEFAMMVTDSNSISALYDRMQVLTGPGGPLAKYYSMMSVPMSATLEKKIRTYRGLDIMRYKTQADISKLDPQMASTMKLMLKDMDIAVVKQTYLGATSPADLDAMIDRALDGKADKAAVTLEAMTFFGPGKQAYFDYNFIELMKEMMAELPANPLANLKQLSDAKPIIGAAVTENGRALLQVRIPLSPLTELTTLIQKNAAPATPPAPPAPEPDGKNEKF